MARLEWSGSLPCRNAWREREREQTVPEARPTPQGAWSDALALGTEVEAWLAATASTGGSWCDGPLPARMGANSWREPRDGRADTVC